MGINIPRQSGARRDLDPTGSLSRFGPAFIGDESSEVFFGHEVRRAEKHVTGWSGYARQPKGKVIWRNLEPERKLLLAAHDFHGALQRSYMYPRHGALPQGRCLLTRRLSPEETQAAPALSAVAN